MQEQDWGLDLCKVGGGGGNISADEGVICITSDEGIYY